MAVPEFLSSSYYVRHNLSLVNMANVLDEILTALTGQSPAWTLVDNRPGTASILATSPVDANGRFFDVLFTDVAASSHLKMEFRVRDQNGVTIMTRRVGTTVTTNTWEIWIFSGQYHIAIDFYYQSAAPEFFIAGITDHAPEAQTVNPRYIYGSASKTSGDGASENNISFASMLDNVTVTHGLRVNTGCSSVTFSGEGQATESGYRRYIARELWAKPTGEANNLYWAGRMYQVLYVPSSATFGGKLPFKARVSVPIDTGTTGIFQVSVSTELSGGNKRTAYRVG